MAQLQRLHVLMFVYNVKLRLCDELLRTVFSAASGRRRRMWQEDSAESLAWRVHIARRRGDDK